MTKTVTDILVEVEYRWPLQKLTSLQVEVSSACNLKCPQCFNQIPDHVTKTMKQDLWDDKIKPYLAQLSDIHLVGIGEPLLNRRFFDYVRDAREAGVNVHTTSNLQMVTPEIAERLITSGLKELSFSCDGATPATYESIRRGGRFEKLEAALAAILEARERHNSSTPSLCLNFGATVKNIHELPEVLAFAKRYQVNTVIAYHNMVYVEGNKDDSLFHHQALSDQYFSQAVAYCREHGITLLYPGLFSNPLRVETNQAIYCGYPFQHMYVYSDGRVGPCCMDFPDRFIYGNLYQSTLPEVWNDAPIRNLRREMCTIPSDNCRFCSSHLKMDISDPRYFFRFPGAQEYIASLGWADKDGEALWSRSSISDANSPAAQVGEQKTSPADLAGPSVQNKSQDTQRWLEKAIAENETAPLWNDWATTQYAAGNLSRAKAGYRRALELDGSHRHAAVNLGILLFAEGALQKAMPLLEQHKMTLSAAERQIISQLAAHYQANLAQVASRPSGPNAPA